MEEISHAFASRIELLTLSEIGCQEELAEDQPTIEGNSLQKASYVFEKYGVDCFADDTGLEVESLNGEPGVFSARFAGLHKNSEDNMNLLLEKLRMHTNRNARFRTVITWVSRKGTYQFEGVLNGTIATAPKGDMGFGYDPIFVPEGLTKSLAELHDGGKEQNQPPHKGSCQVGRFCQHPCVLIARFFSTCDRVHDSQRA